MELRQLRYFTVLADELSFTRAARRLHVSQPPLSFQIGSLETELGARLFNRTSRSVVLSEAGKAFLPHALAVLARLDEARSHVKRVASGLQGRVQVGLAGSHFLGPFPKFIQQYRQMRPDVGVVLHEMKPSDHLQALRDGQLDVCVSRNPMNESQAKDRQIMAELLWRDPVVVALPPGHHLVSRNRLNLVDLKDEDFVFLRLDSSPFAMRVFAAWGPCQWSFPVSFPFLMPQSLFPQLINKISMAMSIYFGAVTKQHQPWLSSGNYWWTGQPISLTHFLLLNLHDFVLISRICFIGFIELKNEKDFIIRWRLFCKCALKI